MKTKILGTGLTGLVGSRLVELLRERYDFENLSLETGVDITNKEQVGKRIVDSPAGVVLHLAAKTDVDACEKEKESAWAVNVEGTRNVLEACKKTGKKIIFISSDFVFDGKNPPAGGYTEEDTPHPINYYGQSKYEAEKLVQEAHLPYLICRLAFPYRASFAPKKDFFRAIFEKLKNGQAVSLVTDMFITPTFIDDIALALEVLLKNDNQGVYHLVGSSSHTPLEIAHLISKNFALDESLIKETTRETYFAGRAVRPWKLALKNDKLKKLGVKMSTLEEGLIKIKSQDLISKI